MVLSERITTITMEVTVIEVSLKTNNRLHRRYIKDLDQSLKIIKKSKFHTLLQVIFKINFWIFPTLSSSLDF